MLIPIPAPLQTRVQFCKALSSHSECLRQDTVSNIRHCLTYRKSMEIHWLYKLFTASLHRSTYTTPTYPQTQPQNPPNPPHHPRTCPPTQLQKISRPRNPNRQTTKTSAPFPLSSKLFRALKPPTKSFETRSKNSSPGSNSSRQGTTTQPVNCMRPGE